LTTGIGGYIIPTMRAKLILHTKEIKGEEIVEIKIWQLPRAGTKQENLKFSIVYIKNGRRLIGYDNAEGKGYHRHFGGHEEAYQFVTIWKLLDDFKKDLRQLRGRNWDED
jgi:hypothetical protein